MKCVNHIQQEADGFCVYCGKPFCKDCLTEIGEKYYCRKHVGEAFRRVPEEIPITPSYPVPPSSPTIINNFNAVDHYPTRSRVAAALLCLFLGVFGLHRFYVGKIGTGLIWFFTFGFFGIGWFLDLLSIILGFFRDRDGMPLV
ncbi:MAG: TM2 domain-containing protein [Clostridiales bacterium]|jgi:hypothetical protein|nr:TM2 domain-containing protein [Clostridiales bacterium]